MGVTLPEARAVMARAAATERRASFPRRLKRRSGDGTDRRVQRHDRGPLVPLTRFGFPCLHGRWWRRSRLAVRPGRSTPSPARGGGVSPGALGEPTERIRGGARKGAGRRCLSVITALLGTPYEPDFRGRCSFSKRGGAAYRIDRMLTQWVQSGGSRRSPGSSWERWRGARRVGDDIRRVFRDAGSDSPSRRCGFAGHAGKNVACRSGCGRGSTRRPPLPAGLPVAW